MIFAVFGLQGFISPLHTVINWKVFDIILLVESAALFIPSTSSCSISSCYTISYTHNLITVSHHPSLLQPFTPDLKPIGSTNKFCHPVHVIWLHLDCFTDLGLGLGTGVCLLLIIYIFFSYMH